MTRTTIVRTLATAGKIGGPYPSQTVAMLRAASDCLAARKTGEA